jgi:hypothetical protein
MFKCIYYVCVHELQYGKIKFAMCKSLIGMGTTYKKLRGDEYPETGSIDLVNDIVMAKAREKIIKNRNAQNVSVNELVQDISSTQLKQVPMMDKYVTVKQDWKQM